MKARRLRKLPWQIAKYGGVDIIVTHAPPKGLGDAEDLPHRGFESFVELLDRYRPRYLLHGHVHLRYGRDIQRHHECGETKIINVCEKYDIDIPDEEVGNWKKPGFVGRVRYFLEH